MSSSAARPGRAQGAYPERQEQPSGRLERALHVLRGAIARRRPISRSALEAFASAVEDWDSSLPSLSDAVFQTKLVEMRERLAIEGLDDALLPGTFALVREAARRSLGMSPYRVQLMGGWIMARGMLAEMETGEGKTLTATLPACAAALAGIPVHVISANDYLVERDAEAMRPLYQFLGLSVGRVIERERDAECRCSAYACDVTYGTAKQIAFDYLRDRLARGRQRSGLPQQLGRIHRDRAAGAQLLLRGLCFAIVDEADSVLIDEARTPLILSGSGEAAEQRKTYLRALRLARALHEGDDFQIERRSGRIRLNDGGRKRLAELARPLRGFWTGPRRREEWVLRALRAEHLLLRDRDYLVCDQKVQIIDQPTGRLAADRSWERGLHQLVEVKEDCKVTAERETLARISYQQFFRRYLRLAGTTGTAREVAAELWSVYRLDTAAIPTRLPVQRRDLGMRVFGSEDLKWEDTVRRVEQVHRERRPVLVGTRSVASSEYLGQLLEERGLPHRVLNARQNADEAEIVARAGGAGCITVATNMAGRGTDIHLGPGVVEGGGLHVIATQRSEARRIDRQLFGRSARQGDPGSFEAILSLEDAAVSIYYPSMFLHLLARMARGPRSLPRWLGRLLTYLPQRAEEREHERTRRELVDLEEYLDDLLAFSGPSE